MSDSRVSLGTDVGERDPGSCPDCGHEATAAYCPSCGQRLDVDPKTMGYWLRVSLDETLSLDGRLPRTLAKLILRPDFLTREWMEGRRRRWSQPFRLYLLASAVFFTAGVLSPVPLFLQFESFGSGAAALLALGDTQREASARAAPQLVIVLVPLFTVFLKYAFDHRRYYSEHLVHAFHLHAFALLMLSLRYIPLLPRVWVDNATGLWLLAYLVRSGQRVYGRGLFSSGVRSIVVLVAHLFVLSTALDMAGRIGGRDPLERVAELHESYWELRDTHFAGEGPAQGMAGGDPWVETSRILRRYRSLEGFLRTPHVRADIVDLLIRIGSREQARVLAEEVLVGDPDHLLVLGFAGRIAEADDMPEVAASYRARFLVAYPNRVGETEFANRHSGDVQAFRREAETAAPARPIR